MTFSGWNIPRILFKLISSEKCEFGDAVKALASGKTTNKKFRICLNHILLDKLILSNCSSVISFHRSFFSSFADFHFTVLMQMSQHSACRVWAILIAITCKIIQLERKNSSICIRIQLKIYLSVWKQSERSKNLWLCRFLWHGKKFLSSPFLQIKWFCIFSPSHSNEYNFMIFILVRLSSKSFFERFQNGSWTNLMLLMIIIGFLFAAVSEAQLFISGKQKSSNMVGDCVIFFYGFDFTVRYEFNFRLVVNASQDWGHSAWRHWRHSSSWLDAH